MLVWNAFLPYPQAPSIASIQLADGKNFAAALDYEPAKRAVVEQPGARVARGRSSRPLLGALIAWLSLRMKRARRWIALLDQLATAPLAIPGMIFGVGLAWLYLVLPVPIYGTRWILLSRLRRNPPAVRRADLHVGARRNCIPSSKRRVPSPARDG